MDTDFWAYLKFFTNKIVAGKLPSNPICSHCLHCYRPGPRFLHLTRMTPGSFQLHILLLLLPLSIFPTEKLEGSCSSRSHLLPQLPSKPCMAPPFTGSKGQSFHWPPGSRVVWTPDTFRTPRLTTGPFAGLVTATLASLVVLQHPKAAAPQGCC